MNEQKIHITAPISRDDLETVIAGLEAACGQNHIEFVESFDLLVKDERQAAALMALFSGNDKREKTIPKRKPKMITAMSERSIGHRSNFGKLIKAWRVFLPGSDVISERITIEEKNLRLSKGVFEPGTILHHPLAGRQRVTGAKGSAQGMEPESEVHHD
jgi:hypothetical protein